MRTAEGIAEVDILQTDMISPLYGSGGAGIEKIPVGTSRINYRRNIGVFFIAGLLPAVGILFMPCPVGKQIIVLESVSPEVIT